MGLFYENLWQKGLGQHAALRAAQLEMIRRNRERHGGDARPVTWGAFVLDGEWR
jgi:CHAT domain-containing protein